MRRSAYDADGQPLESMSAVGQQQTPDEVWGYVDDTSMVVSLNAAADSAAQLGRLTDHVVQSFSGPQIFARLQRLGTTCPGGLTACDKSEVWELIAK